MNFDTFEHKLKKLNKDLYIQTEKKTYSVNKEFGSTGIYLKNKKREQIVDDGNAHYKNKEGYHEYGSSLTNAIEKHNAEPDTYVAWVAYGDVPEGEVFEGRQVVKPGWRSIVRRLIKQGIVGQDKVRKVFNWEESTYDRMTYEQKMEFQCQQAR